MLPAFSYPGHQLWFLVIILHVSIKILMLCSSIKSSIDVCIEDVGIRPLQNVTCELPGKTCTLPFFSTEVVLWIVLSYPSWNIVSSDSSNIFKDHKAPSSSLRLSLVTHQFMYFLASPGTQKASWKATVYNTLWKFSYTAIKFCSLSYDCNSSREIDAPLSACIRSLHVWKRSGPIWPWRQYQQRWVVESSF